MLHLQGEAANALSGGARARARGEGEGEGEGGPRSEPQVARAGAACREGDSSDAPPSRLLVDEPDDGVGELLPARSYGQGRSAQGQCSGLGLGVGGCEGRSCQPSFWCELASPLRTVSVALSKKTPWSAQLCRLPWLGTWNPSTSSASSL